VDRLPKRAKLYPLVDLATGSSILNAGAFGGNIANNFFYKGALTSDGYNLSSDNGLPRPSGSEP